MRPRLFGSQGPSQGPEPAWSGSRFSSRLDDVHGLRGSYWSRFPDPQYSDLSRSPADVRAAHAEAKLARTERELASANLRVKSATIALEESHARLLRSVGDAAAASIGQSSPGSSLAGSSRLPVVPAAGSLAGSQAGPLAGQEPLFTQDPPQAETARLRDENIALRHTICLLWGLQRSRDPGAPQAGSGPGVGQGVSELSPSKVLVAEGAELEEALRRIQEEDARFRVREIGSSPEQVTSWQRQGGPGSGLDAGLGAGLATGSAPRPRSNQNPLTIGDLADPPRGEPGDPLNVSFAASQIGMATSLIYHYLDRYTKLEAQIKPVAVRLRSLLERHSAEAAALCQRSFLEPKDLVAIADLVATEVSDLRKEMAHYQSSAADAECSQKLVAKLSDEHCRMAASLAVALRDVEDLRNNNCKLAAENTRLRVGQGLGSSAAGASAGTGSFGPSAVSQAAQNMVKIVDGEQKMCLEQINRVDALERELAELRSYRSKYEKAREEAYHARASERLMRAKALAAELLHFRNSIQAGNKALQPSEDFSGAIDATRNLYSAISPGDDLWKKLDALEKQFAEVRKEMQDAQATRQAEEAERDAGATGAAAEQDPENAPAKSAAAPTAGEPTGAFGGASTRTFADTVVEVGSASSPAAGSLGGQCGPQGLPDALVTREPRSDDGATGAQGSSSPSRSDSPPAQPSLVHPSRDMSSPAALQDPDDVVDGGDLADREGRRAGTRRHRSRSKEGHRSGTRSRRRTGSRSSSRGRRTAETAAVGSAAAPERQAGDSDGSGGRGREVARGEPSDEIE